MSDIVKAPETTLALPTSTYGTSAGGVGKLASLRFFGPKAKGDVIEQCAAAEVQVNTFYLNTALGVTRVDPCRVFVLDVFNHFAKLDGEGKLFAARPCDDPTVDKKAYYERALALLLVNHPAGLQPAVCTTVKAMCRPWKIAGNTFAAVQDAEAVAKQGPQWASAAQATQPHGRFVLELSGKQEKGQAKGANEYNVGIAKVLPPTEDEVIAFNAYASSPPVIAEIHRQWAEQIAEVQKLFDQ